MEKNISIHYRELRDAVLKGADRYIDKFEPFEIQLLINYIKSNIERLNNEAIQLYIANPDYNYPENIEPIEYWKNTFFYEYDELNRLKLICESALNDKTKKKIQSKPKVNDALTAAEIALILHYKIKGKHIWQKEEQNKEDYFKEETFNIVGSESKTNMVVQFYNSIGTGKKSKGEKDEKTYKYYDPLLLDKIEKIIPYLKNYPAAKAFAEKDIYSFKIKNKVF